MERLVSLFGILVLVGIGYLFSADRKRIPWRVVILGTFLQAWLALFLVRPGWVPAGATVTAALCLAALFPVPLPERFREFARLVAVGLGILGIAVVLAETCRVTGDARFTLAAVAAAILVALLPRFVPRVRAPLVRGGAVLGLLAVPALLWTGHLPGNFVYTGLSGIGAAILWVVSFAKAGTDFVFGGLARERPFVFAIDVAAIILLFSALMSVLYFVGILPKVVGFLARILHKGLGVSGAESLATAANVFVGQTEAPLLVRPYLARMTRSEITALMAGGFATIAGSVFAIYVLFLKEAGLERGAADLICASVMSAPAAFVFAKLFVPETEIAETAEGAAVSRDQVGTSLLDALANGITAGVRLAVNVAAMLLVFYALITMLNEVVDFVARVVSPGSKLDFQRLYAYPFAPFAWLMGVPWDDCLKVGQLLGTKTIFNEFIAYESLGTMYKGGQLSPRAAVLSTYALCGFANFGSIGVQIGGLSALAPERRADFVRFAFRSMVAGTLACQLTACIVGVIGGF